MSTPPELPDLAELLALARSVAGEAGALVARMRAEGVQVADTKSSIVDVVTAADRASEELIRARVAAARPDDGFLGEEGSSVEGTSGLRWIVDPIDGTVNYLYGLPNYCVSVAVAHTSRDVDGGLVDDVVVGVVFNPVTGDEYTATLGGGAHRNGLPIVVRPVPPLAQALVATGFGYDSEVRARQGAAVARMLPHVRDIRRLGSCALDLCAVAAGECDAYVEEGPAAWDHAAGGLVAREAGARFEVLVSASGRDLLVCVPSSGWSQFLGLLRDSGFTGAPG